MASPELKKMLVSGLAFSGGLSLCVLFYNIKRKSNFVNTFSAKLASTILFCAMFHELMGGFVHFVYPYDCHHYISGLSTGFGIKDDNNAMTAMAMITSIWGGESIIIGFAMMVPFLIDVDLFVTRFFLAISFIMRSITFANIHVDIINDLSKNMPAYIINTYSSWENIRKTPPGKHLNVIKAALLLLGFIFSLIGEQKKVDGEKKSKKLN